MSRSIPIALVVTALVFFSFITIDAVSGQDNRRHSNRAISPEQARVIAEVRSSGKDAPAVRIGTSIVTVASFQMRLEFEKAGHAFMREELNESQEHPNPYAQASYTWRVALGEKYGLATLTLANLIGEYAVSEEALRRGFGPSAEEIANRVAHDRELVEQGHAPEFASYVEGMGAERFWSEIYPATLKSAIATEKFSAATRETAATGKQHEAWAKMKEEAVSRVSATVINSSVLEGATVEQALACLAEARSLAASEQP